MCVGGMLKGAPMNKCYMKFFSEPGKIKGNRKTVSARALVLEHY